MMIEGPLEMIIGLTSIRKLQQLNQKVVLTDYRLLVDI